MPLTKNLDELKKIWLGKHGLKSVEITQNCERRAAKLLVETKRRQDRAIMEEVKKSAFSLRTTKSREEKKTTLVTPKPSPKTPKNEKSPKAAKNPKRPKLNETPKRSVPPPKAKESPAKKRRVIEAVKPLIQVTPRLSSMSSANAAPKPKKKAVKPEISVPSSTSSSKPPTPDLDPLFTVPKSRENDTPTPSETPAENSSPRPESSASDIPKSKSPMELQRTSHKLLPGTARIPKLKIKLHSAILSNELEALLDEAAKPVSIAPKIPKKPKMAKDSPGKMQTRSPLQRNAGKELFPEAKDNEKPKNRKPEEVKEKPEKKLNRRDNWENGVPALKQKKYLLERKETTDLKSPLQCPTYLSSKANHAGHSKPKEASNRRNRSKKRGQDHGDRPSTSSDLYSDYSSKILTKLPKARIPDSKNPSCTCFLRSDTDRSFYQPFICSGDLEDVGMTILKVDRDSLQMDLKYCEDAECNKEYFKERVQDMVSIDDYVPEKSALEEIDRAGAEVEFLLVVFWDSPDNNPDVMRSLYHNLKCKNSVAVLTGLIEDSSFSTYLLPYVNHDLLPTSMSSRRLNFIGITKDQPAFVYAIVNRPKLATQSSAVSSTSVLPEEVADLPDGVCLRMTTTSTGRVACSPWRISWPCARERSEKTESETTSTTSSSSTTSQISPTITAA
ncbi:hypothetical protein L596_030142 [Steinernema carpocapsae]|uniref:Uncharacterized protein n=1 Tax=Steinernema carpocapsae TaxID=34508 RepID=A0A4U5LRU7_STECR|nr:hypothetical protein L596_030142 [Steinernema carpocapsae]